MKRKGKHLIKTAFGTVIMLGVSISMILCPMKAFAEDNADAENTADSEDMDYGADHGEEDFEYYNEDSGMYAWVHDGAELLSNEEIESLCSDMYELTDVANVAFLSLNENDEDEEVAAREWYTRHFGQASGYVFLIDMENRQLAIAAYGDLESVLSPNNCDTICDNVYTLARDGRYYECAESVLEQAAELINGNDIARPFKHISNALLAAIIALLINYFIARLMSSTARATDQEVLENISNSYKLSGARAVLTGTVRTYSPESSDSDSGSSSGGSSGGGGSSGSHGF